MQKEIKNSKKMNTENNKIIQKFMNHYENMGNKGLLYHSDWNWLMEVVEKIESLKHCQIDISLNWCRISYKDIFNYDSRGYFKGITKIEAVYNACISFIEWYNENKI